MYQFILDYYQFYPDYISSKNDCYIVFWNDHSYYLHEVINLEMVYWQYSITINHIDFYSFILNRYDSIISNYQNKHYVLLLSNQKKNVSLNLSYHLTACCPVILQWYTQWLKRADYIEFYYSSLKGKYSIIDESIDYYSGLMELSIFLVKDYKNYQDSGYIQRRLFTKSLWYNPLNLMIDIKEREFAEYLKYIFWNDEYRSIDLKNLIYKNRNRYNFQLVLARIVYPNYYFNLVDQIVFFQDNCEQIKDVINRSVEFSKYFDYLVMIIQDIYPIKKVSF